MVIIVAKIILGAANPETNILAPFIIILLNVSYTGEWR
jgi:hypothetical protein